MFIKYNNGCGDNIIVNVPDSEYWEIKFQLFDDNCCDNYNLYLVTKDRTITLRDTEYWSQGRDIPYSSVGGMYEELVDVIGEKIADNVRFIDIDKLESELIEAKYYKKWLDKGYICIYENGSW